MDKPTADEQKWQERREELRKMEAESVRLVLERLLEMFEEHLNSKKKESDSTADDGEIS